MIECEALDPQEFSTNLEIGHPHQHSYTDLDSLQKGQDQNDLALLLAT